MRSRLYQELRWRLSNWGVVDARTATLLCLAQLAVVLCCFLLESDSDEADAANTTTTTTTTSRRLDAHDPAAAARDSDRLAAILASALLVAAEIALFYLGSIDDNRTDILVAGALAVGLAGFVAPIWVRRETTASLGALVALGVLGVLVLLIALLMSRKMGFQSFLRLGGEMQHRRLYSAVLTVRTLTNLDLLACCGFSLLYYLSFWQAAGWDLSTTAASATAIALGVSCLYALVAFAIVRRLTASWLLLVLLTLGLGAAVALYVFGGSATSSSPPPHVPCLAGIYWLTMSIALLAVRGLAVLLHLLICCKRLPRPAPPTVPEELASLSPQQKKALNKIAKGEVLDVQLSGNLDDLLGMGGGGEDGGGDEDDEDDGAGEEGGGGGKREFVAFNLQLKTLRWGWQSTLGVDQMTAITIEGPGIRRPGERRGSGRSNSVRKTMMRRLSRSKSDEERGEASSTPVWALSWRSIARCTNATYAASKAGSVGAIGPTDRS